MPVRMFTSILKMSLTASFVILILCAVRFAMKKAPKIYSYLLWALVLFRLLCPVSLPADFSAIPEKISSGAAVSAWEEDFVEEVNVYYDDGVEFEVAVKAGRSPVLNDGGRNYVVTGSDGVSEPKTVKNTVMPVLTGVWMTGILIMLLPGIISYIRIRKRTNVAVPIGQNVYIADDVDTPFVIGFFRPRIYLPATLDASERDYIIAHERHHIHRGDQMFKALGFLALALHWFNPLVWLAFALAVRDMEMSCDEAVVRKMGEQVRADYSASLLKLATGQRLFSGSPLAFGENDPVGRVRNLSKWKKPAVWVMIICVVVCIIVGIVLLTNLKASPPMQNETPSETTTVPNEESTPQATDPIIEPLPEMEYFTMEDFSFIALDQTTYADVCERIPQTEQMKIAAYSTGCSCTYPTEDGGEIIVCFTGEDLVVKGWYLQPAWKSEYYPLKDTSVFSFIVPGETTIDEVMHTVPHPNGGVPATSGMLTWLEYAVLDGTRVRIYFAWDSNIVHRVEIDETYKRDESELVKDEYPLVFAEFKDDSYEMVVLGYYSEGKILGKDTFAYSGKPLMDYLELTLENPVQVVSDILPVGTGLILMNAEGGYIWTEVRELYCVAEPIVDDVHVFGKLKFVPANKGYYIGAPALPDVMKKPADIVWLEDGFQMDLDTDGWADRVNIAFSQSDYFEEFFDYTIKVKVKDREYIIQSEEDYPCEKKDVVVWPLDLEQDGIYELIVLEKCRSRFRNLFIYQMNGDKMEEMFCYCLDPEP